MKTTQIYFFALLLFVFASCKLKKNIFYLNQDVKSEQNIGTNFMFKYKIGDVLSITLSSVDQDAIKPFNQIDIRNSNENYNNGNSISDGYLIDDNGEIKLPIIGKIKLVNLTRQQANDTICEKLKIYVQDPIVNVRLINFKITVLGSVNHPGTYVISNERVNVFEAIGLASDAKITAERKNVLLIREEGNVKKEYRFDLTSKSILNSEVYYLQQNDIIYIQPNATERLTSTVFNYTGVVIISFASLIFSSLNFILK